VNLRPGFIGSAILWFVVTCWTAGVHSQVAPSAGEMAGYSGLLAAATRGHADVIRALVANGADLDVRDAHDRTPLHVATYGAHHASMRALVAAGADPNALEDDRYDIVTIAAVADDLEALETALSLGARADNITSPYYGTALIAAAHLGHVEIVRALINAGAPLDHVNNLGWTAVIEAIVLGDGGPRHVETLKILMRARANLQLADQNGRTPLELARLYGHDTKVQMLIRAGAQ
jgi:ankyrin repeat protein